MEWFIFYMSVFHWLSLRDGSNICSWLPSSAVWSCFHHLSSLPLSLNVTIPGTSAWNNTEADGFARKSAHSSDQRAEKYCDRSHRLKGDDGKYRKILKITCSSFSYIHRSWNISLCSIQWLVFHIVLPVLYEYTDSDAVCKSCLLNSMTPENTKQQSQQVSGVSFPSSLFRVFSTVGRPHF